MVLAVEQTVFLLSLDAVPMETQPPKESTTKDVAASILNLDAALTERHLPKDLRSMAVLSLATTLNKDVVQMESLRLVDLTMKAVGVVTLDSDAAMTERLQLVDQTRKDVTTVVTASTDAVLMALKHMVLSTKAVQQRLQVLTSLTVLSHLTESFPAIFHKTKEMSVVADISWLGTTIPQKEDVNSSGTEAMEETTTASDLTRSVTLFVLNLRRMVDATCLRLRALVDVAILALVTGMTTQPSNVLHSGGEAAVETPTTSRVGKSAWTLARGSDHLKSPNSLLSFHPSSLTLHTEWKLLSHKNLFKSGRLESHQKSATNQRMSDAVLDTSIDTTTTETLELASCSNTLDVVEMPTVSTAASLVLTLVFVVSLNHRSRLLLKTLDNQLHNKAAQTANATDLRITDLALTSS